MKANLRTRNLHTLIELFKIIELALEVIAKRICLWYLCKPLSQLLRANQCSYIDSWWLAVFLVSFWRIVSAVLVVVISRICCLIPDIKQILTALEWTVWYLKTLWENLLDTLSGYISCSSSTMSTSLIHLSPSLAEVGCWSLRKCRRNSLMDPWMLLI